MESYIVMCATIIISEGIRGDPQNCGLYHSFLAWLYGSCDNKNCLHCSMDSFIQGYCGYQ